jgi:peptidoglycan/xylan/chitin deacetylase (PgdA/CDA1 family)
MRLGELAGSLCRGEVPRNAIAVTFDDGYQDNLDQAAPLLQRYEIPATIFVATGYLGGQRLFWWDELERLLLRAPALPERLELTVAERRYAWELKPNSGAIAVEAVCDCGHEVEPRRRTAKRERVHAEIYRLMRPLAETVREVALTQLRRQVCAGEDSTGPRAMTVAELRRLAAFPLIDVGAHTISHPALAYQPRPAQRAEIAGCKRELEALLNAPVDTFSYPFGGAAEVGAEAPRLAKEAGFAVACTTEHAPIRPGMDPMRLPRLTVENWSGDEFAGSLGSLRIAGLTQAP